MNAIMLHFIKLMYIATELRKYVTKYEEMFFTRNVASCLVNSGNMVCTSCTLLYSLQFIKDPGAP